MSYDFQLAWRNIRNRPLQSFIPVLVVALAIALSVSVIALADGAEEGVVQASDPFGVLVVGAPGSSQQLVLSSILLQGNPVGNISYSYYEDLEDDDRAQWVVPLAFGDNVGGARIIGTNHNFFQLRRDQSAPPAFQLAEGELFVEIEHHEHDEEEEHSDGEETHEGDDHEDAEERSDEVGHVDTEELQVHHDDENLYQAVLGSAAAERLGLRIGDQFLGTHGVGSGIAENIHADAPYTVVGILERSNTPYDFAVYTQLESVWHVHEHGEEEGVPESAQLDIDGLEVGAAAETDQITSILILPSGFIEQNQLVQQFYSDPAVQVAFPGDELVNLLDLLNQGQQILNIVGVMVLGIAGMTLFLSMYSAILSREQSIAIMRSLGSSRITVFRVIIFETLMVSIVGALAGRLLGYGLAWGIADVFSRDSAIPVPIRLLPELEVWLWGMSLGVGLLAGVIPAMMAYRVNVVEKLFPT